MYTVLFSKDLCSGCRLHGLRGSFCCGGLTTMHVLVDVADRHSS